VNYSAPGQPFSSATSFPSPILTGATFDDDLAQSIGVVSSTEARAFNNAERAGLNYWTPNINPYRDPRWGRGQETPGEDPYRISQYAYNFVSALQGGASGADPRYKVMATCKHFAGYDMESWNGNNRMGYNAIISSQDLSEYYTPPFQSCVRDAHGAGVMCAYTAINGVPSCANSYLLNDIGREHFGLGDGWITGDCFAVQGIYYSPYGGHNYTNSTLEAGALAMNAGVDIDCGLNFNETLVDAVKQNLTTEDKIREAQVRLWTGLVRYVVPACFINLALSSPFSVGWFDPAEGQPYRQLGWSDVNTPEAQALALSIAEEGIVLFKNNGILPLSPSIKNIALVGPWANATVQMQGNYYGAPPFLISPLQAFEQAGFNISFASGTTISGTNTSGFEEAVSAAQRADVIVFMGGVDATLEQEFLDRENITWPGNQLDLVSELEAVGKPLIVLQMGGGQVDSSSLRDSSKVSSETDCKSFCRN
jgi:xylan 1,4-beta-xylosidase